MSIMRDTYIMKQNGKYDVYQIGSFIFPSDWTDEAKSRKLSVFDLLKNTPAHGKPFATGLDESAIIEIAMADHSTDDGNAGYSKYAGDSVYLIDMDNQKAFYRKRNKTNGFDTQDRKTTPYFTGGAWEEMK
jgi:hypothetical protein